jgi:hypothetical protein
MVLFYKVMWFHRNTIGRVFFFGNAAWPARRTASPPRSMRV